jgi:hypothetical protein
MVGGCNKDLIRVLIDFLVVAVVRFIRPTTSVSTPTMGFTISIKVAWGTTIIFIVVPFSSID